MAAQGEGQKEVGRLIGKVRVLISRFWWLRGAAAAVTAAALVPQFVELDRYRYLLGIHLVIVSWTEISARIGLLIGQIPFVPQLSAAFINSALFASSIALPGAVALAVTQLPSAPTEKRKAAAPKPLPWIPKRLDRLLDRAATIWMSPVVTIAFSVAVFAAAWFAYYELATFEFTTTRTEYRYETIPLPDGFNTIDGSNEMTIRRPNEVTATTTPLGLLALLVFVGGLFCYSLYRWRSIRRGFVFAVTFFIMSEILYQVSAPWLADEICSIARDTLTEVPGACVDPT